MNNVLLLSNNNVSKNQIEELNKFMLNLVVLINNTNKEINNLKNNTTNIHKENTRNKSLITENKRNIYTLLCKILEVLDVNINLPFKIINSFLTLIIKYFSLYIEDTLISSFYEDTINFDNIEIIEKIIIKMLNHYINNKPDINILEKVNNKNEFRKSIQVIKKLILNLISIVVSYFEKVNSNNTKVNNYIDFNFNIFKIIYSCLQYLIDFNEKNEIKETKNSIFNDYNSIYSNSPKIISVLSNLMTDDRYNHINKKFKINKIYVLLMLYISNSFIYKTNELLINNYSVEIINNAVLNNNNLINFIINYFNKLLFNCYFETNISLKDLDNFDKYLFLDRNNVDVVNDCSVIIMLFKNICELTIYNIKISSMLCNKNISSSIEYSIFNNNNNYFQNILSYINKDNIDKTNSNEHIFILELDIKDKKFNYFNLLKNLLIISCIFINQSNYTNNLFVLKNIIHKLNSSILFKYLDKNSFYLVENINTFYFLSYIIFESCLVNLIKEIKLSSDTANDNNNLNIIVFKSLSFLFNKNNDNHLNKINYLKNNPDVYHNLLISYINQINSIISINIEYTLNNLLLELVDKFKFKNRILHEIISNNSLTDINNYNIKCKIIKILEDDVFLNSNIHANYNEKIVYNFKYINSIITLLISDYSNMCFNFLIDKMVIIQDDIFSLEDYCSSSNQEDTVVFDENKLYNIIFNYLKYCYCFVYSVYIADTKQLNQKNNILKDIYFKNSFFLDSIDNLLKFWKDFFFDLRSSYDYSNYYDESHSSNIIIMIDLISLSNILLSNIFIELNSSINDSKSNMSVYELNEYFNLSLFYFSFNEEIFKLSSFLLIKNVCYIYSMLDSNKSNAIECNNNINNNNNNCNDTNEISISFIKNILNNKLNNVFENITSIIIKVNNNIDHETNNYNENYFYSTVLKRPKYNYENIFNQILSIIQISKLNSKENKLHVIDNNLISNTIYILNKKIEHFYMLLDNSIKIKNTFMIKLILSFFNNFTLLYVIDNNYDVNNVEFKLTKNNFIENEVKYIEDNFNFSNNANNSIKINYSNIIKHYEDKQHKTKNLLNNNLKIKDANILRRLILRIVPLIKSNNNIVYSVFSIFNNLIVLFKVLPLSKEDCINFSTEDPANVVVNFSLNPIFYEIYNSIALNSIKYLNNLKLLKINLFIIRKVNLIDNYYYTFSRIKELIEAFLSNLYYIKNKKYSFEEHISELLIYFIMLIIEMNYLNFQKHYNKSIIENVKEENLIEYSSIDNIINNIKLFNKDFIGNYIAINFLFVKEILNYVYSILNEKSKAFNNNNNLKQIINNLQNYLKDMNKHHNKLKIIENKQMYIDYILENKDLFNYKSYIKKITKDILLLEKDKIENDKNYYFILKIKNIIDILNLNL